MIRTPRKRTRSSTILTNPNPKFVSLVRAGANLTPFLAVKAVKEASEDDMNLAKITKAADSDISKLVFSKKNFADEQAVKNWLTEGGYDEFEITDETDDYVIKGADDLTDVQVVEAHGVKIYVGKRPVETEKEEADAAVEAEAAAAVVAKDEKSEKAEEAKTETKEEESSKAEEEPITLARIKELIAEKEAILKAKGVYEVADLSMIFKTLYWMVEDSDWNGIGDKAKDEIVKASENLLKAIGAVMESTFEEFVANFENMTMKEEKVEEVSEEKEEEAKATTEKEEEAPAKEEESASEKDEKKDTGKEETESPGNEITDLKAQVSELTDMVKSLLESKEKSEDEKGRVKSDTRQTLKGADVDESQKEQSNKGEQKTSDSEDIANRRTRSMLGISLNSRF